MGDTICNACHGHPCMCELCEGCSKPIPEGQATRWEDDVLTCRACTPSREELAAEAAAHDDDREVDRG